MKKLFFLSLMATLFAACSKDTYEENIPEFFVLTFEDADYKGSPSATNYWSSLIDNPQYGGTLLNSDKYEWRDENNTYLYYSGFPGTYKYASGGHAISNYVDTDLTHGDYLHQLAVPIKDSKTGFGGHNGSKNFCVHYGAVANVASASSDLPFFFFADFRSRMIDHMYVAPTTYLLNVEENGNGYASALGQNGWLKIVAYGIDEDGKIQTGKKSEFYLYKDGQAVKNWTKWDLTALGKVWGVAFNMEGSDTGDYGLNTPAYFAYDDVAVRNER